jgi:hypothetical protein
VRAHSLPRFADRLTRHNAPLDLAGPRLFDACIVHRRRRVGWLEARQPHPPAREPAAVTLREAALALGPSSPHPVPGGASRWQLERSAETKAERRGSNATVRHMEIDAAKAFWATMTYREKLFFAVAKGNAASFAYERLELHLEAARLQMSRIEEASRRSQSERTPEPSTSASQIEMRDYIRQGAARMRPVFSDVHFYFVAWCGCRNMLETLVGQPEMLSAKRVFDAYRKEFEQYVAGRNSFEHYNDRLPGRPEEGRVREIQPDPDAGARRVYFGFLEGQ